MKKILIIFFLIIFSSCGADKKRIIGESYKIGNLEVAQFNFPEKMNWDDANEFCASLGDGWRLPTKVELSNLYRERVKIGASGGMYWSSTENTEYFIWARDFDRMSGGEKAENIDQLFNVRAVRTIDPSKDNLINNTIGEPIVIDYLEIAYNDFPNSMNWEEANEACKSLGEGWRLPDEVELKVLFKNFEKIGGFGSGNYWALTDFGDAGVGHRAAVQDFSDVITPDFDKNKSEKLRVRAVRGNPLKRIVGRPKKYGGLEFAEKNFPTPMNWEDAIKACNSLGDGWRLPTIEELTIMCGSGKAPTDELTYWGTYHWTYSEFDNSNAIKTMLSGILDSNGELFNKEIADKSQRHFVLAVRNVESEQNDLIQNVISNKVVLGNLEIAEYDFYDRMNIGDAKQACASLGDGWRLPTTDELSIIHKEKLEVGGFTYGDYWSSDTYSSGVTYNYFLMFFGGAKDSTISLNDKKYVRAVRDIK